MAAMESMKRTPKAKDEGGRMKDEGAIAVWPFFILHPSSFCL
jgi:hypothetical protein